MDITSAEEVELQLKPGQGKRLLSMRSVGDCKHLLEATMLSTGKATYGTPYMLARDLQPL